MRERRRLEQCVFSPEKKTMGTRRKRHKAWDRLPEGANLGSPCFERFPLRTVNQWAFIVLNPGLCPVVMEALGNTDTPINEKYEGKDGVFIFQTTVTSPNCLRISLRIYPPFFSLQFLSKAPPFSEPQLTHTVAHTSSPFLLCQVSSFCPHRIGALHSQRSSFVLSYLLLERNRYLISHPVWQ